ncbi:sensor histidine kinase [Thalassotalea fusca]
MMIDESVEFSILIVDDNPTNIDVLRQYLKRDEYLISAVTSGEKALEIVPKVNPDLILLDIMMPGLDGYQTCKALKASDSTKDIPVIFVTAKVAPEDLRLGFSVGAVDYITKPVNQDIVQARVNYQLSLVKQAKLERQLLNKISKMAELGSMVGGIAHEVASPLSNLRLSVDYMQEETDSLISLIEDNKLSKQLLSAYLEQMKESLILCNSNTIRANELMNSFKKVAVNQCSNKKMEFRLHQYIEDIILTLKPKLKKCPHEVSLNIDDTITLNSYPGALAQVITNLVNNSLLHGFKGEKAGHINISASVDKEFVVLTYQDDGVGMHQGQVQQAFDKYYSTKVGKGGSGLGLAICKELIEGELEGMITLVSEPEKGVKITMTLKQNID